MCGIAGIIYKNNPSSIKDVMFAMSRSIKHRGPDGEGFAFFSDTKSTAAFSEETPVINKQSKTFLFNPSNSIDTVEPMYSMAFAHRRLSIIDLSESGHQPMCDTSGDYWITFNGEIYNYIELREELKSKGCVFVTQTDTEVALEAYKEWGVNCLQKFNGMWAFAVYDKIKKQVFCARDRVGVKPFYYINTTNYFAFASEHKAFIKSKLIPFEINEQQQFDFLVNANLENTEQSLFKDIIELKPSSYFLYDITTQQLNSHKYYSLPDNLISNKTEKEIIDTVEEKLVNAIKIRLRSDVEIGSCLSGGLDSSIIAGIINYLQPDKQLKLFTVVFPSESYDESNYAKLVSDSIKGNWKTVSPTADDFFKEIEFLNYFQDIPIWSTSTYSQHRVMKLAAENNIKVLLDGQGADELFAGYAHHYMAFWKENFGWNTFKYINQSKQTIPNSYQLFLKQLIKDNLNWNTDYKNYFTNENKELTKSQSQKVASSLNQQLKEDYNGRLKSFLKCEDRCSMAFGIESRVPFADDVELVDFIFSIEGNKKIKNGISKYLLREATQKYIPQQIYTRKDKIGFETPLAKWLLSYQEQVIDTVINQLDFVNSEYLKLNFSKLLNKKPAFLLRLYSLSVWKKVFSAL